MQRPWGGNTRGLLGEQEAEWYGWILMSEEDEGKRRVQRVFSALVQRQPCKTLQRVLILF